VKYGAEKGFALDTFLPERVTRYTFQFFTSVMLIRLLLLALRWVGVCTDGVGRRAGNHAIGVSGLA